MLSFYQPRSITRLPFPFNLFILLFIAIYHFVHSISQLVFTFVYNLYQCFILSLSTSTLDPSTNAVFITGCASGFGFTLANKLDQLGYKVFAGVRSIDQRSNRLKEISSNRLQIVQCDVTKDDEVAAAVQFVQRNLDGRRLSSVVNNAGVVEAHGFEWGPNLDVYEQMLKVNVIGQIRVTRHFCPFLRRNPGSRLIFVSSFAASVPFPSAAAYSASKAALSSFASTIATELSPYAVNVSTIEPAFFRTPINDGNLMGQIRKSYETSPQEIKDFYSNQGLENYECIMRIMEKHMKEDLTPVIDSLLDSVTLKRNPQPNQVICDFFESLAFISFDTVPKEIVNKAMFNLTLIRKFMSMSIVQGLYPKTDKLK